MPDTPLIYVPVFAVVALMCIDTAIAGKFRPFRNSEKGWLVSKRSRWLLAAVGVSAIIVVVVLLSSKGR